jgi:hypothetical protein
MVDPDVLAIANKVVGKLPSDKKEIGILAMIEIGLILIKIARKCHHLYNSLPKAVESARRPNVFQRMALRQEVRRTMKKCKDDSDRNAIVNAILDFGKEITITDVDTLLKKVAG